MPEMWKQVLNNQGQYSVGEQTFVLTMLWRFWDESIDSELLDQAVMLTEESFENDNDGTVSAWLNEIRGAYLVLKSQLRAAEPTEKGEAA